MRGCLELVLKLSLAIASRGIEYRGSTGDPSFREFYAPDAIRTRERTLHLSFQRVSALSISKRVQHATGRTIGGTIRAKTRR